jgi:hypothetical protein
MNKLVELTMIQILIPVLIVTVTLAVTTFVHVLLHPNYRFGNRTMWIIIVLLVQIIGPIIYFAFGKEEE